MTNRMKHVVVNSGLQAADIRPSALMSEFIRLSLQDAKTYFADPAVYEDVACPGCGNPNAKEVFTKNSFGYKQCAQCETLFVSPRPSDAALAKYYAESSASKYRSEHFSRQTAKARRYHLLRSHALWIGQIFDEVGNKSAPTYANLNTVSPELFDELNSLNVFEKLYSVEPLVDPTECAEAPVEKLMMAELHGAGAISSFEKLEHQFSPEAYCESIFEKLAPGGLFFFTTRSCKGFDLQILWDKAPYIFVPEHLNLLSIDGIRALLERSRFELVELSTPGQLDVEFVRAAVQQDPTISIPPFFHFLLNQCGALAHEDFQAFLQKHRLSSHVRVAARKPGG